jgi:SAM-dependent methyltransferase
LTEVNPRVNYDDIAATYDARYTSGVGEGQHTVPVALQQLLRPGITNRVLEVGCGTGFWLSSFHGTHDVYGLDLSPGMLSKAKAKHTKLVCGTAEQLPFPANSFDLIYCVNAFHHFVEKEIFIGEAARLLRNSGILALIAMDPHGQTDTWYIYDYFPGTRDIDLRRFPPVARIAEWMKEAGLCDISDRVVERILNHQYGRGVLNHSVLQKNGTSQLILLSNEAYATGFAKLKQDLDEAEAQGRTLQFREDISLVMVSGRKL